MKIYKEHRDDVGKSTSLARKEVALRMDPENARSMPKNSRKTTNVESESEPPLLSFVQAIFNPTSDDVTLDDNTRESGSKENQTEVISLSVSTVFKPKDISLLNLTKDLADERYIRESSDEFGRHCVREIYRHNGLDDVEFRAVCGAGADCTLSCSKVDEMHLAQDQKKFSGTNNEAEEIEDEISKSKDLSLEQDSMEPFLSHSLFISYDKMPQPRYFKGGPRDVNFLSTELPRRPRSPVRRLLSGRFDLGAETTKLLERVREHAVRRNTSGSKDCTVQTLMNRMLDSPSCKDVDPVFVQVSLEEVTLSLATSAEEMVIDDLFIMETIWMIMEPNIVDFDEVFMRKTMTSRIMILPKINLPSQDPKCEQCRFKVPLRIPCRRYPPRKTEDLLIHRTLPWGLVCPSHEQGTTKNYFNVRKFIDEKDTREPESSYVPDLACVHSIELPTESFVTRKPDGEGVDERKLVQPEVPKLIEEILLQLMNLV